MSVAQRSKATSYHRKASWAHEITENTIKPWVCSETKLSWWGWKARCQLEWNWIGVGSQAPPGAFHKVGCARDNTTDIRDWIEGAQILNGGTKSCRLATVYLGCLLEDSNLMFPLKGSSYLLKNQIWCYYLCGPVQAACSSWCQMTL